MKILELKLRVEHAGKVYEATGKKLRRANQNELYFDGSYIQKRKIDVPTGSCFIIMKEVKG